ncbi:MAG: glycosyltransferase family 4 protein [Betaproteobacteria bacterium]|nr:glycosyltransferase family 4 protein [Betaproteobacteria bacterium]
MRVAMLGNFPLDPEKIPGGVEAVIRNLAMAMAPRDDIDLHLVVSSPETNRNLTKSYGGFTIHYLPGQRRLGVLTGHYLDRKRLRRALREIKPDIVHAHGTGGYVAAAQESGIPTVLTVHGIRFREVVLFGGIVGWLRQVATIRQERRVLARARFVFVIADYVGKTIAPMSHAKQFAIANPVADKYFAMETTDRNRTVLSVAAVQPRKGIIHLVEAMALVRRKVPDARLKLIGKLLIPEYGKQVQDRIAELGLTDCVEMVGFVTDEELQQAFTGCSVFALCSVEESSPVSIAEAMTLGKPVVATAVGGVPDLVADGATGHLVKFGDVQAIADALTAVLADDDLRARMGAAAKARAHRDFRPAAAAERTIAVYRQVLSEYGVVS